MRNVATVASDGFKLVEELLEFDEGFIKSYNEKTKEYFLEVDIQYPEELPAIVMIYHFYQKE